MGFDSPSHWLIVIAVAVVLFGGYKKLPEMSRSVGRSLRIFKSEMKGLTDDDAAREAAEQAKADVPAPEAVRPVALEQPDVVVAPVSPQVPPTAVTPTTVTPDPSKSGGETPH